MIIFYFNLVCFTFSLSYSVFPFHLVYVFQFLCLFYLLLFLKPLSSIVEKFLHTYTYICSVYNIYILENLWIFA